jgi:hypothetical protein
MARQTGHIFITGTLDDVTYYKMDGIYYARMKSTLSRKKVLTSPRFARTRMHANQLADASRIASTLYKSIPKEKRNIKLFRAIVGQAKVLLAQGKVKEVVLQILMNELFPQTKSTAPKLIIKRKKDERAYVTKAGRLIWKKLVTPNSRKDSLMKTINTKSVETTERPLQLKTSHELCKCTARISELSQPCL